MKRCRLAVSVLVTSALLSAFGGGSQARDAEDLSVTDGRNDQRDYPPIPAANPNNGPRGRANCNVAPYCDNIDLKIEVPDWYTGEDFYAVETTLSWPNPDLNNLNLYLYDTNGTTQLLVSATANHPERITILDPPQGTYFLNVTNSSGPNAGYRVSVVWIYKGRIESPAAPDEGRPRLATPVFDEERREAPALDELPALSALGASASAARAVETPGADGPVEQRTLKSLGPPESPEAENAILPSLIVVLITTVAVGVVGFTLFRHRRLEMLAEEYQWR